MTPIPLLLSFMNKDSSTGGADVGVVVSAGSVVLHAVR